MGIAATSRKHQSNLDILRIIAALSIVILHTLPTLSLGNFTPAGSSTILFLKAHIEFLAFQ